MKQDFWWHQSRLLPYFETSEGWARESFSEMMGWSKSLAEKARATKDRLH
jgi:hypothetical protein